MVFKDCNFGYRITKCNKNDSNWFLANGGIHPAEHVSEIVKDNGILVKSFNRKPKKRYGIGIRIKLIINGKIKFSILIGRIYIYNILFIQSGSNKTILFRLSDY